MKRLGSSDSLGALMSMCPVTDDHQSPRNNTNSLYSSRDFQSMFDEEPLNDETTHISEKKRRLSVHQVKALEKNFEVENKLEPERKVKLATELGLQPRQVAVWFQNRRARWKTKQLERDYGVLKNNYDTLKSNYQSLQQNNDSLIKEIKELKSKLNYEENTDQSNAATIKEEEAMISDQSEDGKGNLQPPAASPLVPSSQTPGSTDPDLISFKAPQTTSSDSNSSAILNEDNSPNSSFFSNHHQLLISSSPTSFRFNHSSSFVGSTNNCISFMEELPRDEVVLGGGLGKELVRSEDYQEQQQQFVKLEEHDFFSGEEACNFFNDEQAPSLHWYCPDQWN